MATFVQLLLTRFELYFKGKVKTKSMQARGKVRERSRQGQGMVKLRSRQGHGKFKARQGGEARSTTVIASMSIR